MVENSVMQRDANHACSACECEIIQAAIDRDINF